jgi:hypothetical protein
MMVSNEAMLKCPSCRRKFLPRRADAKTCSAACRQWAYRRRLGVTAIRNVRRPVSVHFSSATDEWSTPQDTFNALDQEFGFTVDVCATAENAKCAKFYTKAEDGLAQPWSGVCWMNPPYGRTIGKWMAKARKAVEAGATVVALVPARTDTRWWHDHATKGEIRFLPGP